MSMEITPTTTNDHTANASYILIRQNDVVAKTVQVSEHCNVDLNADGFPIGVEVLH